MWINVQFDNKQQRNKNFLTRKTDQHRYTKYRCVRYESPYNVQCFNWNMIALHFIYIDQVRKKKNFDVSFKTFCLVAPILFFSWATVLQNLVQFRHVPFVQVQEKIDSAQHHVNFCHSGKGMDKHYNLNQESNQTVT